MWRILLAQLVRFVVMACIVMIAGFALLRLMPGESVRLDVAGYSSDGLKDGKVKSRFREAWYQSGAHLPVFYISFRPLAVPDSFYYLPDPVFRNALIRLSLLTGRPAETYALLNKDPECRWRNTYKTSAVTPHDLSEYYSDPQWLAVQENSASWKKYIPVVSFSSDNQFSRWLLGGGMSGGILKGDLGVSRYTGRKVTEELAAPLSLTASMTFISLVFSSIVAALLAVWLSGKTRHVQVNFLSPLFLAIYSIPVFWLGTWLLYLFANPDFIQLFPASGIYGEGGKSSIHYWLWLMLPVFCYSLGAVIFMTRLLMEGFHLEAAMDYTRTAYAKGLSDGEVRRKHQFRNLVFPALAVIAGSFPVMLGGSALIEQIFSLPGLGSLMIRAVQTRDVPLLSGFFLITAMVTILVFLVIDFAARFIDPRIRTGLSVEPPIHQRQ